MGLRIDKVRASRILRAAADEARHGHANPAWFEKVRRLSRLCEEGGAKTHIAFLGTAILAKATHPDADLFAIKPTHTPDNPNAYSARTLCHGVLVPLAADLDFSIGVTGREPLNNQPYFRIKQLGDDTPIHRRSQAAFKYVIQLVAELQASSVEGQAKEALVAFIAERRRHQPSYKYTQGQPVISPRHLIRSVTALVQKESESGRRAQGVVAGLMDAFAGPDRVESRRVNDPSRRYPGDVCVRRIEDGQQWEKAIEVRDKPVSLTDIKIFARRCMEMDVREAAVVAVSDAQPPLDTDGLAHWAADRGIGVTVFCNWESIVEQVLFWSADPKPVTAGRAVEFIHRRLIAIEAKPATIDFWLELIE